MFLVLECIAALLFAAAAYVYMTYKLKKEAGEEVKLFAVTYDKGMFIASIIVAILSVAGVLVMRILREKPLEEVFIYLMLMFFFFVAGIIDFKVKIIPNELIIFGLAAFIIAVLLRVFIGGTVFLKVIYDAAVGGFLVGGILLVIALIVKTALGMGDVKMFFVAGLFLGYMNTYFLLFASVIIMAIVSILLLVTKKADRKTAIPMAPFVAVAFFLCLFIGM